jgi:hypothetical protein
MTTIENRSVLVAVSEYGEFGSLQPLAKELEKQFGLHPVFVFASGYGLAHEHGRLVEIEGWSWVQLGTHNKAFRTLMDAKSDSGYFPTVLNSGAGNDVRDGGRNAVPLASSRLEFLVLQMLSTANRVVKRAAKFRSASPGRDWSVSRIKKQLKHAEHIFNMLRPRLVISGQDFALSVTSFLSYVGERHGVKTAIVPFSMPPTTKELIETFAYHGYNKLSGIEKLLCQRNIPHWLNENREHVYSRVPPPAAIAADSLGLTPPQPWLPNSGRGVICAPSKWAREYYLKAGIPSSQLRLTGAPWSDRLVRSKNTRSARRDRLMANIESLASGKLRRRGLPDKLAILSWAPNQYPRKALGCPTYEDLCDQFIIAVQELESMGIARIAVSLHPTLTDSKLLSKLHDSKVFVLRSSLIDYIDCADVFISTVSSTNFWALQCGIPTINFDGYLYGYTEFDEAGAITVRTPLEIFSVCKRLFEDESYLAEIKSRIADRSAEFCEVGGENLECIISTMADLLCVDESANR